MNNNKRFIEKTFPVKEVSVESAREKNIRHGHISTLHIWWARRPLASSRATNYAALIPATDNIEEWNRKRQFIMDFSKWENSLNQGMIKQAREDILAANEGRPPKVLDPFGGGGAIPLEALRLGCETYTGDINPVAVLIQKCTLEYPQKYGRNWGLGIRNWGLGIRNWGLGIRNWGKGGEGEKLQGIGGMAKGDESGYGNIQVDENLSQGGEIRSDISDSESGNIYPSQHSGGVGQRLNEGIYSISESSSGIINGTRNPFDPISKAGLPSRRSSDEVSAGCGDHRQDDKRFNTKSPLQMTLYGAGIRNQELGIGEIPNSQFPIPSSQFPTPNPLLEDVTRWGNWVLEEAKKEIGRFYPEEADGSIPVGYIWARTIPCQNPSCGAEIPLMRQFWLAKKDKKKVALFPYIDPLLNSPLSKGGQRGVNFKIVGTGYEKMPEGFEPEKGTIARAVATCLVCGAVVDDTTTRRLFREGKSGQRMVAVVLHQGRNSELGIRNSGKRYRLATEKDMEIFREAEEYLAKKQEKLMLEWGMDPVPDEAMNQDDPTTVAGRGYGVKKWGDLFNSRQKLALITFCEKVRQVYAGIRNLELGIRGQGVGIRNLELGIGETPNSQPPIPNSEEYAKAVVSYLGLGVNRLADYNSVLCVWHTTKELLAHTFGRQALGMVWDYVEVNPFSDATGNWNDSFDYLLRVIEHSSMINFIHATITQASATNLPYPDNYFDAVFTDPPYYDNVNYAELSDFFYVWLKRTVGDLYPELFSTPLVPKSQEAVANPTRHGGQDKAKKFFESMLKKSFQEAHRVLKPDGIAVIVYAHKSTEGWETLINSLLDSGLIMTGAWPLHTEMGARLNAKESAALASSIYIVARKMSRQPTGFYHEVKEELKQHLDQKLHRLWEEGIGGADFFIAAIGSAIEVFGKYEKVMDDEGNIVRADRMLLDVRRMATDYAVHQILHNGIAFEISDLTKFYVLYRWNYGEVKVAFDEARKLAQSCGIDLAKEWSRPGFIKKEKEFISVLGPQERLGIRNLELGIGETPNPQFPIPNYQPLIPNSNELIDVLHRVLLFWEKGRRDEMKDLLFRSGFGKGEAFYRVAQAISETLPIESKEKKLLDGFLAGRERLREEIREKSIQGRLFE